MTGDRYATTPVTAVTPPASAASNDRYGLASSDNAASSATSAEFAPSSPGTSAPAAAEPGPQTTVQLTTPAGQYRPGGTTSYTGPGSAVEVATRPTAPTSPPPSDPWAPTAPATPATPATGTRTY
jgi:hypothetical protein